MPINNDFESLLDAMTDEGSKENDEFLALAERQFLSAFGELEPFINRVGILSRRFRKWYKAYLLGGGRPMTKYDEMLKRLEVFKHIDADILPEVRAAQAASAPVVPPAQAVRVETPFGIEVVAPPRQVLTVHPITHQPVPKRQRGGQKGRGRVIVDATVEDVAAFCNLVNEKFGEPPTGDMVGAQFGASPNWGYKRVKEASEKKLLDHATRAARQKPKDSLLAIKVAKEFGRIK